MTLSDTAAERLEKLINKLTPSPEGLRFEGRLGTCRGSSPVLKPARGPRDGEKVEEIRGIRFFVPADQQSVFERATLDYDSSFMGKGLFLTWPHVDGCDCQSG